MYLFKLLPINIIYMKRYIIIFCLVLVSIFPSFSQIKVSNPTYIGLILVDEHDCDKMAATCQHYNLTEVSPEEDYRVFTYSDGTKIRFKMDLSEEGNVPVVQVITKKKPADAKKILLDTGFVKEADGYYQGSQFTHRRTRCQLSSGSPSILTFTKVYKASDN